MKNNKRILYIAGIISESQYYNNINEEYTLKDIAQLQKNNDPLYQEKSLETAKYVISVPSSGLKGEYQPKDWPNIFSHNTKTGKPIIDFDYQGFDRIKWFKDVNNKIGSLKGIKKKKKYFKKYPKITLYASWILDNQENRQIFNKTTYLSPEQAKLGISGEEFPNGKGDGENAILCSNEPWTLVSDPPEENHNDYKIIIVKFEKFLNEIYLDYDDYDLASFGIDEETDIPIEETSLDYFIENGLIIPPKYRWYGCYVHDIKPNEIINIKTQYQIG